MELVMFITSILANFFLIEIFYFRIKKDAKKEKIVGIFHEFLTIPLILIIIDFIDQYDIWIIIYLFISIIFNLYELYLDYIAKIEFRSNKKFLVPYMILYFLSFWGYIAINFVLNPTWGIIIFILYAFHVAIMIRAHK